MLIGSVKDKMDFGEAMGMFDGLDEGDLQSKLKETMASIGDFFGKATESGAGSGSGSANETETDHKNAFEEAFSFDLEVIVTQVRNEDLAFRCNPFWSSL